MNAILARLDNRFKILAEEVQDSSWKDPYGPDYDRQWAEDALFHTIGPLTEQPRWVPDRWSSPSEPVPGFHPGGPAPRWSQEEVAVAMAGDPRLLFSGNGNPRSPEYGNKGGSPMYRLARKVARYYSRDKDRSFIADMYGNGMVELTKLMQPGFDESRSAFISWAIRNIQSAMEHGIGGENRTSLAAGDESTKMSADSTNFRGMTALMGETDPQKVRAAANVVKGKYRETRSHDKNPDNPFGPFSSAYYQTANAYADALESQDQEAIERAQSRMRQLIDDVEDYSTPIRGASTGMGQAISTPDRSSSVGIVSMDAPAKGSDDTAGMVGNIVGDANEDSHYDPESISYILDIALNYDLGALLGKSSKYQALAAELGSKGGIGGRMTVNELRYVIRTLGPLGSNYPGRGRPRSALNVPRDSRGWWQPGEDPEVEPIPGQGGEGGGSLWHSRWVRDGYQSMGPTAIGAEMTTEIAEFKHLGIPTARKVNMKNKGGKQYEEAVSKVAVANTINTARIKLKIIADIHRGQLGLDEAAIRQSGVIAEGLDAIDRSIIAETCDGLVRIITRAVVFERSPIMMAHTRKHHAFAKRPRAGMREPRKLVAPRPQPTQGPPAATSQTTEE